MLTALGVFGCFGAYAFLAPATYRTTAIVVAAPAWPDAPVQPPLEAARRVHHAVLDSETVAQLARARAPQGPLDSKLKNAIHASLQVETLDGRTFELSCLDATAEGAAQLCNRLARRAVEKIPALFGGSAGVVKPGEPFGKNPHAEELVAFLAAHPELTQEPAAAPKHGGEARDPVLMALRAERAQIEARLATDAPANTRTDNPYADPAALDPEVPRLRRRLVQLAGAIQARRDALSTGASPVKRKEPSQALRAQWQELLQKASAAAPAAAGPQQQPAYTAQIALEASVPSAPVLPDRQVLLIVGTLIGLGCGGLAGVASSVREDRKRLRQQPDEEFASDDELFPESRGLPSIEPTRPLALLMDGGGDPHSRASELDELARTEYGAAPSSRAPSSRAPISSVPGPFSSGDRAEREVSGIEPTSSGRADPGRVTQSLGSIVAPEPPRGADANAAVFQKPAHRSVAPTNTAYSYVRSERPEPGNVHDANTPSGTPVPGFPQGVASGQASAPPTPISSAPPAEGEAMAPLRGVRSRVLTPSGFPPPLSDAPGSRVESISAPLRSHVTVPKNLVIAPQPVPAGWAPDPSLVPATRAGLCKELYPLGVQSCFVVGVTGVRGAHEESPRVAAELALALAASAHPRVLLIEGNFQRPAVHRSMRLSMPLFAGFSEQLEARIGRGNQRAPWTVLACSPTLHVLAEGMMSLPELVLSQQFEDAVHELRDYYDMIVVSGPVTSEIAASRAVNDVVDGVVLVCKKAGSSEIADASAQFSTKRFSTVLAAG